MILEPPPPKNSFSNDGSFFESFKKITDAVKKTVEVEESPPKVDEVEPVVVEPPITVEAYVDLRRLLGNHF